MASSMQNNRVSPPGYCVCCRTCNMWCWRAFKWLPVLLIVSIVTWSYYAYVIQLCIFTIESTVQQCIYLVLYHILLIMFAWSYWRTIFADIKPIPEKYKLPEAELEKLLSAETEDAQRTILENFAKDLPIVTRTMSGSVRYCNRCVLVKPDRAHHCSICSRCVLKMDHHCPWVNNCVCFHNYKFFMLFLGYALLYCLFIMSTCLPYFIRFWKGDFGMSGSAGRYHIVFAFFVALMFAISLGSLFGYHCYLVAHNRTTLEAFRAPMFRGGADKNGFSMGAYNNFKEVFGNSPNKWVVPVFTSLGDGCEYPVRREHQLQTFSAPQDALGYDSMGITRSSVEMAHETERWRLCPRRGRTVPQIV
ncbi:palmitoyltransferase ZDHHC15B isoform X1 [Vanessa atalanta]|uniref:palmitoyltransferase ZDHHC15B isoform X2 n=1 Tax=Vanessa cardui TaxID=171605 RepID=UPI000E77DA0A|nr:palmitoyltransferase ZDHHC15B isoform X1 [Vanessa tameamea]XP_046972401.1 palmitoyltransferase ZDHHC15B isoform X2 [Vanessa cardui]XP_047537495.1 palmitoyltransferase ZDHHC15B isoform X1 [Vanessa atalanta]